MRFPPPRRALCLSLAAALLSIPLFAQRYDSMSPRELQRRLERDTDQLINSLRTQRSSSSRSVPAGPSAWELQLRERDRRERENRAEQARLDAEWRRDHPNETRQQYFARIDREAAEEARAARRAREDALRAQRAREAAERERQEIADWARLRASYNGYAATVRPPQFFTPAESLDWLLTHQERTQNEWAANQAAMLLIEGVGVPQDIPKAIGLLNPDGPVAKKAGTPHPESRALLAYLQLTSPDAVKAAGLEVNAVTARATLERVAEQNSLAKWYLARALNNSDSPAAQKRALRLISPGALWARAFFAPLIKAGPAGRDPIAKHLSALSLAIIEKQAAHMPALIRDLPLTEFDDFANMLPSLSEPLRTQAMTLYTEALVERIVPLTPNHEINYWAYDNILEKAGEARIDSVYGLAMFRWLYLLEVEDRGEVRPSWSGFRDQDLAVSALTRWSAREDVLGSRARLALKILADRSASSDWWTLQKLNEVIDYHRATEERARLLGINRDPTSDKSIFQLRDEAEVAEKAARKAAYEAFARQDAAAPPVSAVPDLLIALTAGKQWRGELELLKNAATDNAANTSTFAVTDASFDLAKAAAHLDAAFAPGTPATVRRHELFQAMRLGDAFAPAALEQEISWDLPPAVNTKLRKLHDARLRRDEAARLPRALLAKAIFAPRLTPESDALLAEAAAAGSVLASRIQLDNRIGRDMARENNRPPSWSLAPALIAEFDTAVTTTGITPDAPGEWSVVQSLLSANEAADAAKNWFSYLRYWEADRQERLADAEFAKAILPQVDALIATLAQWPGLDQGDPIRREWADTARRDREHAMSLVRKGDGLGALRAFLAAAGRGDRGALELLARHIRTGDGGLPLSPEIADKLQGAAFQMTIADAEVGDAHAANYIGECYREGRGVPADPAQAFAWLRYAAEMGWSPAARTLALDDAQGLNRPPAELLHWAAVRDACEYNELLPKPPRRLGTPRIDLTPIRPQLEAAIVALNSFRTKKPVELTPEQEDAATARTDQAKAGLKKNPANGLVLLAKIAATDNRYIAHEMATILARGDCGVQPDPALAQHFHAAGLALLERDAEYGDFNAAQRLATYALGLGEKPDIPAALRWLTYSAELGSTTAAEALAKLYTDGAPGLPADSAAAARWTAFAESTNSENFKPRDPLRK